MATKTLNYSLEFKQQIVALCRSGQTQSNLAREYGLARGTIRKWLAQAQLLAFPFYGVLNIKDTLAAEHGLTVSVKRIRRLRKLIGIQAIYPKPRTSTPD